MATKTEKNVQLKINKMTKNIFDQLSVQGLISEDELYLLSDDETGSATWGNIVGELSNQTDLKIMLDSKADKSIVPTVLSAYALSSDVDARLSQKADKSEIPTVNNPTITFTQGNAVKGSITLNQANDQTISLDAGGGGGGGGGGSGDYVPLSTDIAGNKTAATIGTRNNGVLKTIFIPEPLQLSAIGANTFTVGTDCAALSANSFAQGLSCVASGKNSIALGRRAVARYDNTFVWSGDDSPYIQANESAGYGTFNIINNSAPDTDILFINGKKLPEIVGGGGGDDIYCKYGSTSDDPPGWNFMSITNGQTYIDYSQIYSITNYSSKPSKIVGYFEFT